MSTGTDSVQKTTIDTWTDKAHTTTNHGGAATISVNGDGTNTRYGYLHFARPFQLGATVFSATLRLHLREFTTEWNGTHTITAKRVTERWGELMLNWSNAPAVGVNHPASVSVTNGSDGDLVELDITDMMNDVSAGSPWFGIRLEVNTSGNKFFYAAENPDQTQRALLDIDWGVFPHAPVNLNPVGNQSVSSSKPVLDWQFSSQDHTATRRQSYSQVQVNNVPSFIAAPTYDSGWVANTNSQWNLNAATSPSFTALSDGDTFFWRVRVKDDQGLASDWTAVARAQYNTKGTLTLSNPPASPPTVDDLTPQIDWGFSGRTQEAFELRLYQYNGDDPILKWRLTRTVSTATAYNIPKGYIKTGEQYRIVILVWDTLDRAVTPGDNDYVTIGRDFSYARNGVPAPVINLTATTTTTSPLVHLNFHRSTLPDYFTVKLNGVEVQDRIDPTEILTSSGGGDNEFDMDFWRAVPAQAGTYEVEAVEDDGSGNLHNSSGNDTDTATIKPIAIHLVDETDSTNLVIYGQDDASGEIRRSATTYLLSGSRRPVQIIETIAGYAYTLTGQLLGQSQRDVAETLIGRAPASLRLIFADVNIEVEIEDGNPTPTPAPGRDVFNISLTVFQTDADQTFHITGG